MHRSLLTQGSHIFILRSMLKTGVFFYLSWNIFNSSILSSSYRDSDSFLLNNLISSFLLQLSNKQTNNPGLFWWPSGGIHLPVWERQVQFLIGEHTPTCHRATKLGATMKIQHSPNKETLPPKEAHKGKAGGISA